jgi:hypothetical protein
MPQSIEKTETRFSPSNANTISLIVIASERGREPITKRTEPKPSGNNLFTLSSADRKSRHIPKGVEKRTSILHYAIGSEVESRAD